MAAESTEATATCTGAVGKSSAKPFGPEGPRQSQHSDEHNDDAQRGNAVSHSQRLANEDVPVWVIASECRRDGRCTM